jgi:hypothetical protein
MPGFFGHGTPYPYRFPLRSLFLCASALSFYLSLRLRAFALNFLAFVLAELLTR